jgi:hypothetical protein
MTSVEKLIADLRELADEVRDLGELRDTQTQLANARYEVEVLTEKLKALKLEFEQKSAEKQTTLQRLDQTILQTEQRMTLLMGEINFKNLELEALRQKQQQGVPT